MIDLTREQAREVDRVALDEYGMSGLVLMENAGRGCVDVLCELGVGGLVVICCGKGNNGGDGFVMARHLDVRGHAVRVLLWCSPDQLRGDAAHNFAILEKSGISIELPEGAGDPGWLDRRLAGADWIVDALLGTGARGEPRPPMDRVIERLNAAPDVRKLAVDVPSGLDCDTGQAAGHTFRADHTCTFVAPKRGYAKESARAYLGEVHVIDIGLPRRLLEELGAEGRKRAAGEGPGPVSSG